MKVKVKVDDVGDKMELKVADCRVAISRRFSRLKIGKTTPVAVVVVRGRVPGFRRIFAASAAEILLRGVIE